MSKADTLPVGKVVGLHGLRGELRVVQYGEEEDFPYETVFVAGTAPLKSFPVVSAKKHKGLRIVKLEGIDSRTDAAPFVGSELSVTRDQLPELTGDEYYSADLLGIEVFSETGSCLGKISKILSTGSNDVYEVRGPKGEVLIPAIKDVVIEIDIKNKRMTVRLLEGLLPEQD